jgi:hypothetical protein
VYREDHHLPLVLDRDNNSNRLLHTCRIDRLLLMLPSIRFTISIIDRLDRDHLDLCMHRPLVSLLLSLSIQAKITVVSNGFRVIPTITHIAIINMDSLTSTLRVNNQVSQVDHLYNPNILRNSLSLPRLFLR